MEKDEAAQAAAVNGLNLSEALAGLRVLVVDNDPQIHELIKVIVAPLEAIISLAEGFQALDMARSEPFDLTYLSEVLQLGAMDYMMKPFNDQLF